MKTMSCLFSLWVGLVCWSGTAYANAVPLDEIAAGLRQRFEEEFTLTPLRAGEIRLRSPVAAAQFYAQRTYRPAWLDTRGPSALADTLLRTVDAAEQEGLRPADYHREAIQGLLRQSATGAVGRWADLDLLLTDAWLTYGQHLLAGRLEPGQVEQWTVPRRSQDLAQALQQALDTGRVDEALQALAPPQPGYAGLRQALARYREIEKRGGWPTVAAGPALQKGARDPRVKALRTRLLLSGDLAAAPAEEGAGRAAVAETLFDEALAEAVRRFQRRHGLADNGVVGADTLKALNVPVAERVRQIELNLERWRWLSGDFGRRYILVNIPDFKMSVVEDGRQVLESKAVVGKTDRPTPVLSATMTYLVLSPRWYVPRSIAVKDKLPRLRSNPYALARQGIRIFDADGREIDPGSVNWGSVSSSNFAYRLRQDPGPRNALGGIKFMFPNPYSVYLHDTPSTHLFGRSQRTFSSGCVRISKPVELAEYLLKDDPHWTRAAIEAASNGRRQRIVTLREEIPVYLLYWTAWVDEDGTLQFRDDIYKRDQRLARTLFSAFKTRA